MGKSVRQNRPGSTRTGQGDLNTVQQSKPPARRTGVNTAGSRSTLAVAELCLPPRVEAVLESLGIVWVADLSLDRLATTPGVGPAIVAHVKGALRKVAAGVDGPC